MPQVKDPCLSCKKKTGGTACIQCSICQLWIHKDCPGMGAELYDLLKKMHDVGGKQYWPCDSCSASMSKVNTRLVSLEKRMDSVEEVISRQKDDISSDIESIISIGKDIEDVRANVNKDNSNMDSVLI